MPGTKRKYNTSLFKNQGFASFVRAK